MFEKGQSIIYAGNGICTIEDIVTRENHAGGDAQQVYVIRLASGLTSYVPTDSSIFMRALIDSQEAMQIIEDYPSLPTREFAGSNSKALADRYRAVIARHDPREMLVLYKSLQAKADKATAAGRRPGVMDNRFADTALNQVVNELAAVLCRSPQEIEQRLLSPDGAPLSELAVK